MRSASSISLLSALLCCSRFATPRWAPRTPNACRYSLRHALPGHGDHDRRDGVDRPGRPLSRPDRGRPRPEAADHRRHGEHRAAGVPGALRLRRRAAAARPQRAAGQGLDRDQRDQHQGARAGRRPVRPSPRRTTITVDPADDNRFVSATPWQYTAPAMPALEWTALGGDVVFGQDAGGNLPQLPVGQRRRQLRAVTGSTVIHISFPGGGAIYMDCRPGRTTGDRASTSPARRTSPGRRRRSTPRPGRRTRPA